MAHAAARTYCEGGGGSHAKVLRTVHATVRNDVFCTFPGLENLASLHIKHFNELQLPVFHSPREVRMSLK